MTNFELIVEGLVVEEHPWILVFPIPVILKLRHALDDTIQFRIADQADQRCPRPFGDMPVLGNGADEP